MKTRETASGLSENSASARVHSARNAVFDEFLPGDRHLQLDASNLRGACNRSGALLGIALLPANWQTHWFRLLVEFALAAGITVLAWRVFRNRCHGTGEKAEERNRVKRLLTDEHRRRVFAEQESRSLSQRLLTANEDERRHLARELHDDLTQRLARLAIDAAQAERGLPAAPDSGSWRRMREELVRLSEDVHSLAYRLHPSILDELGLVEALRAECDHFLRREAIQVKLKSRNVPREIPSEVALCLFRIAQESLCNVARHARARAVEVSLAGMDGALQLSVHDNGIGFNPPQAHEHASLGLASMKERVGLVEGELHVESEPGHGATVVARVPLKEHLHP